MSLEPVDLPKWPTRGNRRRLEQAWIAELESRGLSYFLPEPPSEVPRQLRKAVEEFNGGFFWDCHETLEEVWLETPYPLRFFYHSIIKVAVGFYHLGRHNRHGARVKLSDGVRLLRLLPSLYMGVNTGLLLDEAAVWLARIEGEDRLDWAALDKAPRPRVSMESLGAPDPGAAPRDQGPAAISGLRKKGARRGA